MKERKQKKIIVTNRKGIIVRLLIVMALIVIVTVFIVSKRWGSSDGKVTTVSKASLEKIIELNDLSTLDYTYNAITEVYKDDGETLKYHVAYEGTVTAGIDAEKISVEEDKENKTITISLPKAEIQETSVNMGTMDFIFEKDRYETENVSQEAYKACLQDLSEKAASEKDLLSMARDNAIGAIEALIEPWVQQLDGEYIVEVK